MPVSDAQPRYLVSIHDLMPHTMPAVRRVIKTLDARGIAPVTLFVVPGSGWHDEHIDELRALSRTGYRLAGHGWCHRAKRIEGVYHRLHSALISRDVAEHLALDSDGIVQLISDCRAWFDEHDLPCCGLYVPPAWALGSVPARRLRGLGFDQIEVFNGVMNVTSGRTTPIPMVGFEADTAFRAPIISAWNRLNRRRARGNGWLRIGIHPHDLDLRLGEQLLKTLASCSVTADYAELGIEA